MSTIYADELAALGTSVENATPQHDTHPLLHNDAGEVITALAAAIPKAPEFYDADGSIGTDATAAFRAAVAGGGVIRLAPNTTYTITAPLRPDTADTRIVGAGHGSVLRMVGPAFNLFELDGLDGFHLGDLKIDGSGLQAPRLGSLSTFAPNGSPTVALYDTHTLQSGDVVYVGNPDTPWVGYQQVTLSAVTPTSAAVTPAISNPNGTGFGANTVLATVANGQGGHALRMSNGERLSLHGVTIDGVLRHGLWLIDVDDLRVEGCTFRNLGAALVAQDPYSAFNFGIGGYGVGTARVIGSVFRDITGRRAAGIEVRTKVNQPGTAEMGDWVIQGCTFKNLGSTSVVRANNGAGVNLVDAESSVGWRRIVIQGCTWDSITDGFVWVLNPTGHVAVIGNTMTNSRHGPFIEVDAPLATIMGNTCRGGQVGLGAYAGIWVRCSPGTGDFAAAGQGVDCYGAAIVGNVLRDIFGAVGVGIYVQGGPQVPARGPRQLVIADNSVNGCTQDGIQVDLAEGSYHIHHNHLLDCNAAILAATTLTAAATFTVGQVQTIEVASTAWFYAGAFVQLGADGINRQILSVQDATHLVLEEAPAGGTYGVSQSVANPFPGNGAIYLNGDANVASAGATTARVSGLAGLGWGNGDALGITGEGALTVVGTPADNGDGTWTVGLSAPLALPHTHGETVRNTTQGNAAAFKALHVHADVQIDHNAIGQDALGTTRYGLYYRNVIGPIVEDQNRIRGMTQGERSITGYPQLFLNNPVNRHVGWQTDASIPLELHLRDWQYRTGVAGTAKTTAAMTAGVTQAFAVDVLPPDWAVGDFVWIEAIAQLVASGDGANGELGKIDAIAGTTITLHGPVAFAHASGVTVYKAAYNPKLRVWGADSTNNSQGHYATLGYDENNLAMKLVFASSGHVPSAHALIEAQGATSNLRLTANNRSVEVDAAAGAFRPRLSSTNDLGDAQHRWKNVYAESIVLFSKVGAPVDGDFTSPQSAILALDTANSRLYVRVGTSWKSVALA